MPFVGNSKTSQWEKSVFQAQGENQSYVACRKGMKFIATVIPGNTVKSCGIIPEYACAEYVSWSLPSKLFIINSWCSRNNNDGIYCAHSINNRSKCFCSPSTENPWGHLKILIITSYVAACLFRTDWIMDRVQWAKRLSVSNGSNKYKGWNKIGSYLRPFFHSLSPLVDLSEL